MPITHKAFYKFTAIPIQIPVAFFTDLKQKILKFTQNL